MYCAFHKSDEIYSFIDKSISKGKFKYDGIFCATDALAIQIIDRLNIKGISVPDDVQIIGYNGIKIFGLNKYPCSTIEQPLEQMATTAVDILLSDKDSNHPALICLPVRYCGGGTTK